MSFSSITIKLFFAISLCLSTTFAKANITDPPNEKDIAQLRFEIIKEAKKVLGTTYKYGAYKVTDGLDCSGLIYSVYRKLGIDIERTSKDQARQGRIVSLNELKMGDLVFFGDNHSKVNHVALVVRRSRNNLVVIHSTSSGGVMIDDIMTSDYWKNKLLFGSDLINKI